MAQARNFTESEFADFFSKCNMNGVIVAYDYPLKSFEAFTSLDREELLGRNKEGLSWLMVSMNAIRSSDEIDKKFYKRIFTLIISRAIEKNCFSELVALTDVNGLTISDWIEKKKQRDLFDIFLMKLSNAEKGETKKLGYRMNFIDGLAQLRQHQHHFSGCDVLLLENFPEPNLQLGPTCGYNAASYVTNHWSLQDNAYRAYPARLFGPDKEMGTSLKMLGKKAGITGVGGIYDVNYFASILQDTPYHSQVVDFETEDEFYLLFKLALAHQLPVILPVDWRYGPSGHRIVADNGNHSHYITIVGCVFGVNVRQAFFVSSNEFFTVSLRDLFKSTSDLQKTPAATFFKKRCLPEGWENKQYYFTVPEASPEYKYRTVEEKDLKNLRRKMVLVYPKTMKARVETLFAKKSSLDTFFVSGVRS